MSIPGEVYYLPPQEGERLQPEKGDRPFVLLSLGASAAGAVTLAYCSTQSTEALHGAAHVWVDSATITNTGLRRPTFVYPSRLASYVPEALGRPAGRVGSGLTAWIRRQLQVALGMGTGVCADLDLPRGNRRGRVVLLNDALTAMTGYSRGLVVTEPGYSSRGRQQTIVPLLPADDFEVSPLDVLVRDEPWVETVIPAGQRLIAATSMITTVFEPEWIAGYTIAVVDTATMDAVEAALALHFGLPPRQGEGRR